MIITGIIVIATVIYYMNKVEEDTNTKHGQ